MRILMVHKYFHRLDGVGTYVHHLTTLLEENGHTVAPFAMHDPRNDRSPWEHFFVSAGATQRIARGWGAVQQLRRAWWHAETADRFRAMLRAFAPDVIHVHNWYTHLSPSFLKVAQEEGIPVVMTAHDFGFLTADYGLAGGRRYIKNSLLATLVSESVARWHRFRGHHLRGVSAVICLSRYVASTCESFGVPARILRVIPPPLAGTVGEEALPDPLHDRTGITFLGRLEEYKGVHDVIAMAKELPDIPFVIMGDGPLRALVQQAGKEQKNIDYQGWVPEEEARKQLRWTRLAIVPSRWSEPFGLVALEAQAAGAVTLVSDRGGLPEVVEDGRTGFVLPAGECAAWIRQIQEIYPNTLRCKEMGAAAMDRALTLGNPQAFLATMTDIYTEVCQQELSPSRNTLKSSMQR